MIDNALRNLIVAAAGVGARVQPATETNVGATLPRVAYSVIDVDRDMTDHGPTGLATATYQLDVYAADSFAARTVFDAIRVAINGYSGSSDGTTILLISVVREQSNKGEKLAGANNTVARHLGDLQVVYRD